MLGFLDSMAIRKKRSTRVPVYDAKQSKKSKEGENVGKGEERNITVACNESKNDSTELESKGTEATRVSRGPTHSDNRFVDSMAIRKKRSKRVPDDGTITKSKKSKKGANVVKRNESKGDSTELEPKDIDTIIANVVKGIERTRTGARNESKGDNTELEPKDSETIRATRDPTHLDSLARQRVHGNKKDASFNGHGHPIGEANVVKCKERAVFGAFNESKSDSIESEPEDTQTTRVTRGPTQLDRLTRQRVLGDKKDVSFNGHGHPIGEAGAEMQSYIGVLARQKVKLTCKTWKQVPQDVKDLIWESVNLTYNVHPSWKTGCLSSANAKWRQWKTYLTNNFILKHKNNPEKLNKPPVGLGISAADWKSFVTCRTSEDFLKLRSLQKERREKNIYPHRLSRKGYAGLAETIKHELGDDEKVDRAILWKRARMDKNGEFEGDDLIKTVKKIDNYIKLKEEGVLKINGPTEDVLTMALETPEHAGRVRGVGGHTTPTVYFNYTSRRRHVDPSVIDEQQKELVEVKKKVSEQDARIEKLEAIMFGQDIENDEKGSSFVRLQFSKNRDELKTEKSFSEDEEFDDEVQLIDKAKTLQGKEVALTLESSEAVAAYGTVVALNGRDDKLHGAPLPKNCMCVSIDEAVDKYAPLPLPIPSECDNIGDAVGTHVAWPTHLIVMPDKKTTKKKSFDQAKEPTLSTSLPRSLKMLYCYSKRALDNGENISVCLDDDVFGGDKCYVHVHIEDINPFCELEPISCNCIVVYMWVLYKKMKEDNTLERFRFVHPSTISHQPTTRTDKNFLVELLDKRVRVLADRLIGASTGQLVLVPCNIGFHWNLTVIDPFKEVVFLLDPLGNRVCDGDWKYVVNRALKLFKANMGRKGKKQPVWKTVQVPRQPDEKQCGFYVMRYMREIIEGVKEIVEGVSAINQAWIQSLFTKDEYSQKEIDEVRSEWAECMQDYIF